MSVLYFLDYRFHKTPDGAVWTDTSYDYPFWEQYIEGFGSVTLVARARTVDAKQPGWKRVDGPSVAVAALPFYLGPVGYLKNRVELRRKVKEALAKPGMVMLRVPAPLAHCAYGELRKARRPYAVEVVGDASAALAPGVVEARGRAFFRWWFARGQTRQCRNAVAASYVANILQERYPAPQAPNRLVCSDVRLESSWLRYGPRRFDRCAIRLVTVATLSQTYKGLDVLIDAVALCRNRGLDTNLTIVGEGKLRGELEGRVRSLGVHEAVYFRGALPWGQELMDELDKADIFVLPSRVEALPRALIEAMARALPCVATRVGAVPELLDEEWLVDPDDSQVLAHRIESMASNAATLGAASARNLEVAQRYAYVDLRPRWVEFYKSFALPFSVSIGVAAASAEHARAGILASK